MDQEVQAVEFGAGFAAVEEGDDRMRPGALLHYAPGPFYAGRLSLWGREFGPVTERSTMLSFCRRFGLARSKMFTGGLGATLLEEKIVIKYEGDDSDFDLDESNYNFGAWIHLSASLTGNSNVQMSVDWDSHLFLAGQGGILLANARKQTLALMLGFAF